MSTFCDVLKHKTPEKRFAVIEHVGIVDAGMYIERYSVQCEHQASKQFNRFKFNANPLTFSLALFEGEDLKEFWSPKAL